MSTLTKPQDLNLPLQFHNMSKILYVEDDQTLGFVTKDSLEQENFTVEHFTDGALAKKAFQQNNYDICIIDVMLPIMDGFALAEYIRSKNAQIPIIFVTAKSMQEDKLKGLKIGADDYITKPFSIEELILKINVFLKRKYIQQDIPSVFPIGQFSFDLGNLTLTMNGDISKITQREGELLYELVKDKNRVVKRKALLEKIWGKEDYFLGRSMDVFISRLRKHLSPDPGLQIENVHGVGFRLTESSN